MYDNSRDRLEWRVAWYIWCSFFVFRERSIKNQLSSFLNFMLGQVNLQVMPKFQKQNDAFQEVSGNFVRFKNLKSVQYFVL
jgi:hypothetical protein